MDRSSLHTQRGTHRDRPTPVHTPPPSKRQRLHATAAHLTDYAPSTSLPAQNERPTTSVPYPTDSNWQAVHEEGFRHWAYTTHVLPQELGRGFCFASLGHLQVGK